MDQLTGVSKNSQALSHRLVPLGFESRPDGSECSWLRQKSADFTQEVYLTSTRVGAKLSLGISLGVRAATVEEFVANALGEVPSTAPTVGGNFAQPPVPI